MKYELLTQDTISRYGRTLYRVRYLRNVAHLRKGELGGYIESEGNLDQNGECVVCDEAHVYGDARVCGNALVDGNARVCGSARVYNTARVSGNALVDGNARVCGSARVCDTARVCDNALLDSTFKLTLARMSANNASSYFYYYSVLDKYKVSTGTAVSVMVF